MKGFTPSGAAMRTGALTCCLLITLSACAQRGASARIPEPWKFEAQAARGEVRVLPVVALHDEIPVQIGSYIGLTIPWERQQLRARRTAQLDALPGAMGERLPGAVNGELGSGWSGQFHHGAWPIGAQEKLRNALELPSSKVDIDVILGELGRGTNSQATLFTWVRQVDGDPVSMHGFPGSTVDTPVGPVHVNHADEAYVVTLQVGLALVTNEGEVLIRYEHDYQGLLSGRADQDDAGSQLARKIAADVSKVWATEAELNRAPAMLAQESW